MNWTVSWPKLGVRRAVLLKPSMSPLHGMPGTVADFVSKQSGSLWQEARNSGTGPQWGATVFYLLKFTTGTAALSGCSSCWNRWPLCPHGSWLCQGEIAVTNTPAVQWPESPLKIRSTNPDYIYIYIYNHNQFESPIITWFLRCLQGWRLIPCPQVFPTRIQEIPRHIGIGMMKQLDFLLCTKEREKSFVRIWRSFTIPETNSSHFAPKNPFWDGFLAGANF